MECTPTKLQRSEVSSILAGAYLRLFSQAHISPTRRDLAASKESDQLRQNRLAIRGELIADVQPTRTDNPGPGEEN